MPRRLSLWEQPRSTLACGRRTDSPSLGSSPVEIDVTNLDSIRQAVAQCDDVTILVNNAGIAQLVDDALDKRVEEVTRSMLEVNLFGVIRVTQAFAPVLGAKEHSGIINVLSNVSWKAIPAFTPYSISKAAVWSYTNHVRMALAAQNTEVVGLHVGFVDTDLTADVHAPKSDPRAVARKSYDAERKG